MGDLTIADSSYNDFDCPHCGEHLEYSPDYDDFGGFKDCPKCGAGLFVGCHITWNVIKEEDL